MRRLLALAVASLSATLCPGPAAAQTNGGSNTYFLDPETDAVWIGTQDGLLQVSGEWRSDGAFVGMSGVFNPFTYTTPRIPDILNETLPMVLGGQSGILAKFRGFYTRGADGAFTVSDVFASPEQYGCHETANTGPCLLGGSFIDSRGQSGIYVLDEQQQGHLRFWDGKAYRVPVGVETAIEADDQAFDVATVLWRADGGAALDLTQTNAKGAGGSPPGSNPTMTYKVYTAAGSSTRQVTVPTDGTFAQNGGLMVGGDVYVMGQIYTNASAARRLRPRRPPRRRVSPGGLLMPAFDQPVPSPPSGPGLSAVLVKLVDAFGDHPTAQVVAAAPADQYGSVPVSVDAQAFYYAIGQKLYAQSLTARRGAATELADCGNSLNFGGMQPTTLYQYAPWVYCGQEVLQLANGVVAVRLDAGGPVVGGQVLKVAAADYDLVVSRSDGTLARLRHGKDTLATQILPLAPSPSMSAVWDERTGPCGAFGLALPQCLSDGKWQERDLGIGSPQSVRQDASGWWAASLVQDTGGIERRVYRRPNGGAWRLVAEWPGDGPLALVRVGLGGMAADTGDAAITMLTTEAPTPAYDNHARVPSGTLGENQPAVAVDGTLYGACLNQAGDTFACAVAVDGTTQPVKNAPLIAVGLAATPLRRGALLDIDGSLFVVRDTRAIAIGDLYGEFLPLPNETVSLSVAELGTGQAVIQRQSFDQSGTVNDATYYLFDGEHLQQQGIDPSQHQTQASPFGGVVTTSNGLTEAWRGDDGVWRTGSNGGLDAQSYGRSPVDALFGNEAVAPDYVNDAVVAQRGLARDVVMATDDGIWRCPLANATRVTDGVIELPQTQGCGRLANLPYVKRLLPVPGGYLVQQGDRIAFFGKLTDVGTTLSQGGFAGAVASHLSADGSGAAWVEGNDLVYWRDGAVVARTLLPADAGKVAAVGAAWVCAATGVYHLDGGAWTNLTPETPCLALTARPEGAHVATATALLRCHAAGCEQVAALPALFAPDGVLGEAPGPLGLPVPALVLGNRVYTLELNSHFADVTPPYALGQGGSALLTVANRLHGGVISLDGAGVIVLGAWGREPLHVRVQ